MTSAQKKAVLKEIRRLSDEIERLEANYEVASNAEFSSASVSSGGGSKSYTRADPSKMANAILALEKRRARLYRQLTGMSAIGRAIYTVYL